MIRNAILALSLLMFSWNAEAQVQLGFVGGPSFTSQKWLSNNVPFSGTKIRTQFHIGMTSDIPVAARWSVQPELLFSYQGWKNTQELTNLINDYTYNIGYVKLPVLMTYNKEYDNSFFIIGGGAYLGGIALTNQQFLQNYQNLTSGKLRIGNTFDDQVTFSDYGLKFKSGFILKKGLGITASYEYGLKDINPTLVKTFNRMLGVSLNYMWRISDEDKYRRYSDSYMW
jgi:hypothetical protein